MPQNEKPNQEPQEVLTGTYLRPTPQIPDHELLRRVGRGSYGEVWLARNAVGTFRAVKFVYRNEFKEPHPYEREFNGMRKFEPLSRSNEGLVDILQVGRVDDAGYFYYVMELADDAVNGQDIRPEDYVPRTLSKELLRRGRLPVEECLDLGLTLNLALGHLHRAGLIHRDIKPSNIIFIGGVPKLADIGLVVSIPDAHSLVGTIGFIAPEGPNSAQADVYSMGKVLYEAGMGKDRQDFPEPLTNLDQGTDATALLELNAVILRACAGNPNDRYGSAEEMNADLALLKSGDSVRRKRTLERRLVKFKRASIIAGAVTAVVAAALVWQGHQTLQMKKLAKENFKLAAAGQQAAQEAGRRLNEMDVAKGQKLLEQDDCYEALLWFAHGFGQVTEDPVLEEAHRIRFGTLLRRVPKVSQIFAHDEGIIDFKFSRDGSRLVSASKDHTARVWDLQTGKAITPALQHNDLVRSCDFSPDGHLVVTASADKTAKVWDAANGNLITTFQQHTGRVLTVAFDPDGKRVLSTSLDNTVRVWDPSTGQELIPPFEETNDVPLARFSPNGKTIATASGKIAQIWDSATGRRLTGPLAHDLPIWDLEFSPDGRRLAIGEGGDRHIPYTTSFKAAAILWDTATGKRLIPPLWHDGTISTLTFSPDGRYWATAGFKDHTAKFWDATTGDQLGSPISMGSDIWDVQFSPDGRSVVISCANGNARVWEIFTGRALTPILRHTGYVVHSAFSPDGRFLATAGDDHTLKIWDLATSAEDDLVLEHRGYLNWLASARFSPDGKQILTVCFDGVIRLWDSQDGRPLAQMIHGKHAEFARFSPDGKKIITAVGRPAQSGDGLAGYVVNARIWDALKAKEITPPLVHEETVRHASFSPDSKRVITAAGSKARMWDTASGEPLSPWLEHGGSVVYTDFSPDGRTVLTASYDHTAQMWDAETGQRIGSAMKHTAAVLVARFSPDGKKLLTVNDDQTARVWDASTGAPVTPWLKHNEELYPGRMEPG